MLPLVLLSEGDESENPSSSKKSDTLGEVREKEGDWGLKMSEMRPSGLKPLRPEEDGSCRRLDRGVVESPDSPDIAAGGGCRRPCDRPDDCLDDNSLLVLAEVDIDLGVLNGALGCGCGVVIDDEVDLSCARGDTEVGCCCCCCCRAIDFCGEL